MAVAIVFRSRIPPIESIIWAIDSGRCFGLPIATLAAHESLVTNQSVSAGTGPNGEVSGIRWWELRSPNSSPVIFQEGTYAPGLTDGIHRWMGSIAMNSLGDIALGFSASNGTNPSVFPSVFYTARHDGDPPGQMTLGEGSIMNGTGSQTAGGQRWGDYTSIDIDPTDDQTFWSSTSTFPRRAPSDGDCESARLTWPAEEARHQHQRPRRVQLLRRRQLLPLRAVNTPLRQGVTRSFRGRQTLVTIPTMAIRSWHCRSLSSYTIRPITV